MEKNIVCRAIMCICVIKINIVAHHHHITQLNKTFLCSAFDMCEWPGPEGGTRDVWWTRKDVRKLDGCHSHKQTVIIVVVVRIRYIAFISSTVI